MKWENVSAKYVILEYSKKRIDEFREKYLLNLTLKKSTGTLGGNMSPLMVNELSDDIKEITLKRNAKNEKDLKEKI